MSPQALNFVSTFVNVVRVSSEVRRLAYSARLAWNITASFD